MPRNQYQEESRYLHRPSTDWPPMMRPVGACSRCGLPMSKPKKRNATPLCQDCREADPEGCDALKRPGVRCA